MKLDCSWRRRRYNVRYKFLITQVFAHRSESWLTGPLQYGADKHPPVSSPRYTTGLALRTHPALHQEGKWLPFHLTDFSQIMNSIDVNISTLQRVR